MPKKKKKADKPKSGLMPLVAVVSLCIVAVLAYRYYKGAADARSAGGKSGVLTLTESTFKQTITSGVSVIDFWATWCGPCRQQAPIMEDLALRYSDRAVVAKVDVDAEGGLAQKYGVRGIPTIIVFKNGEEAARFVGVTDGNELAQAVNEFLK